MMEITAIKLMLIHRSLSWGFFCDLIGAASGFGLSNDNFRSIGRSFFLFIDGMIS